jgi:hypothetical protein
MDIGYIMNALIPLLKLTFYISLSWLESRGSSVGTVTRLPGCTTQGLGFDSWQGGKNSFQTGCRAHSTPCPKYTEGLYREVRWPEIKALSTVEVKNLWTWYSD